jgi:hypothetical protein
MPRNPDKTAYSQGFPEGFEVFASINDPRDGVHPLHHFGELREDWLRKWLELPNGIPCANTFSRVFQAIEPTAFAGCIAEHLARLGFAMEGGQIAIDGKALRGSRSGETTHLHAVSAWACEAGITLSPAAHLHGLRSIDLARRTARHRHLFECEAVDFASSWIQRIGLCAAASGGAVGGHRANARAAEGGGSLAGCWSRPIDARPRDRRLAPLHEFPGAPGLRNSPRRTRGNLRR